MLPSRYVIIDERSPYPVKRRGRGGGGARRSDAAITLLPPDPYLIVEKPDRSPSLSPTVYRTTAPKSARHREASPFVILGETVRTPVQSRPGSPSGRVSPFRGRGFKTPTGTRANSRAPSPSQSPRKSLGGTVRPPRERPRVAKDIGLPPKSPMKSQPKPSGTGQEAEAADGSGGGTAGEGPTGPQGGGVTAEEGKAGAESGETEAATQGGTSAAEDARGSSGGEGGREAGEQPPPKAKPRQPPVTPRAKKPPVSPLPLAKTKAEKTSGSSDQPVTKRTAKPPVPAKKIGLKTSLRTEESGGDQEKRSKKEGVKGKEEDNAEGKKEKKEGVKGKEEGNGEGKKEKKEGGKGKEEEDDREGKKEKKEGGKGKEEGNVEGKKKEKEAGKEKEEKEVGKEKEEENGKGKEEKREVGKGKEGESDGGVRGPERLVPCFQPDKCQIAPPTMASPSPIITPTISTPSTTSELATSSVKNSESIAAAPTTVTPSSLSSVSSTVVLSGSLARREAGERSKAKGAEAVEQRGSGEGVEAAGGEGARMVRAGGKEGLRGGPKESLSGEITSTKVIRAEADVEVLSPNNLRESPPRMAPPNVAWDEGRVPNGEVPTRAESEGKLRRALSVVWRLMSWVFCCRCWRGWRCCRGSGEEGAGKGSVLWRVGCCGRCGKGWKCCEGSSCCRRKRDGGEPKPKPKPKPRKCCAKATCSCKGCGDKLKNLCICSRDKLNSSCRSLFCLNMLCCQKFLRKFKCCHKLKCCQKNGLCSCCNPNVKKDAKKLHKKGSRTSNNSRERDNLDAVLVEHTSLMKAAIPVLPSCLAVFCLMLNLFVPGLGTLVSGVLCLCFGKARFSAKDTPKNRVGSFIVNTIIGVAQLFTVVFCLVGWGWSIWWGVIMYKLSRRQKRLKLAEKNQKEAEGSNVNHNHVDVEQG